MTQLTESLASQVIELADALDLDLEALGEGEYADEGLKFPPALCAETEFFVTLRHIRPMEIEGVSIPAEDIVLAFRYDQEQFGHFEAMIRNYQDRMTSSALWVGMNWTHYGDCFFYRTSAVVAWIKNAEAEVLRRRDLEH